MLLAFIRRRSVATLHSHAVALVHFASHGNATHLPVQAVKPS
jgi:hypothetical protein